jgi:NAD(P)-dependent dehydrogenase (short-subunit alcohol dehydrogenase family)
MCGPLTEYLESMFSLEGRTAVVTGGGGVLCSRMAEALGQAGASVILWDVRQDALNEKLAQIRKTLGEDRRANAVQVDLMNEDSICAAIEKSVKFTGQVDILLNGAGGNRGKSTLQEVKVEDIEFVLKLNLLAGCILPVKHFSKYWIEKKIKGVIINIASMASFNPLSGVYAYSAAKAAVMNQTVAQAKELAPFGIRANAIAPGFLIAEQNRALLLNPDGSLTPRGQAVIHHTPAGRFGEPQELVGAVLFLASDKAAGFVSGVTLPVDGAYLAFNI